MFNYLKTTIIAKVVMAITGLILIAFLFGHALGNLQYFIGSDTYNTYAAFLQGNKLLLWSVRIVLIISIILHIISAVYLRLYNNEAKPIKYQVQNYLKSKLTARTMLWTGLLLTCGLVYHLLHFTTGDISFEGGYDNYEVVPTGEFTIPLSNIAEDCGDGCDGNRENCATPEECEAKGCFDAKISPILKERHDVYKMLEMEFSNPLVAISYIIFVIIVGFHLNHAIQSALHTIGIQGPKLTPILLKLSVALSVVLVLLFIILPISVMLGLAGGCC